MAKGSVRQVWFPSRLQPTKDARSNKEWHRSWCFLFLLLTSRAVPEASEAGPADQVAVRVGLADTRRRTHDAMAFRGRLRKLRLRAASAVRNTGPDPVRRRHAEMSGTVNHDAPTRPNSWPRYWRLSIMPFVLAWISSGTAPWDTR
jgi:hypothetical protein